MTKKTRNILFLIFVAIFIVAAPLVCLYAAGYQVGKNFSIQKTGILVIKIEPTSATIYLENKTQQNLVDNLLQVNKKTYTTPNKIKNLLPGKYDIKLDKDGYWPWEKQLEIGSGQSIYIEKVNLFRNNLPTVISNQRYTDLVPAPNKKILMAIYQNGVDIINLDDDSVKNISLATSTVKIILTKNNCSWSPNNDAVILGPYLYNLSDLKTAIDLSKQLGSNPTSIKWNQSDKNHLLFTSQKNIYDLNLSSQTKKLIAENKSAADYLARDNNLFLLYRNNGSTILNVWNLSENKSIREINLPDSEYAFINRENNLLNVVDQTHKTLYLIDPFAELKPILEIINNADKAAWINGDKLIFANDYELWIYDAKNYYKTLLTRISEQIADVFPFVNENYLFYTTDRSINVMEMDARDKYNIIKLVDLEKIKNPYLNKDGSALYFYSEIGNNLGIYKLTIQ